MSTVYLAHTAISTIEAKVRQTIRPLCSSLLKSEPASDEDTTRLQEIDKELTYAKQGIRDVLKTIEKLRADRAAAAQNWEATKALVNIAIFSSSAAPISS